jgi:hypothetical protein
MPKITVELASNYENITRPVAMSIARDVMKLCNIPQDTPLYMPGEFDQINQAGTTLDGEAKLSFGGNQKVKVVVEETLRNESVMQQVIKQNEMPAMFEDRRLGISIRPVYMQSDLTLTFQYTCASRQQAKKWQDGFAARRAENRTSTSHQIEYEIPIQEGVLALLAHLHSLREKTAGYGETVAEWFKSCQRRPFQLLATQDKDMKKSMVSVPETQVQITGWWDFTDIPREQKNGDTSTWAIEFSYRVMYHRCTHLYLVYPLVVHQSHISRDYFDSKPRFSLEDLPKESAIGIRALDYMDHYVDSFPQPVDGLRYPTYDEWIPGKSQQPPKSIPAASWMLSLDPKDSQKIGNLTQLPDIRFTKEMDTYLRANYAGLGKRGQASVLFTIYVNDSPMTESWIEIDKDLNIRATAPLDLRQQYHLRMSFPTYYPKFTKDAVRQMQLNSNATLQVFQSIVPRLNVEYAKAIMLDDQYLPIDYIVWFYKYLQDHGIGYNNDGGGNQNNGGASGGGHVNTGTGVPGYIGGPGGNTGGNGSDGSGSNGHTGGNIGGGGVRDPGVPYPDDWINGGVWTKRSMSGARYVQFLYIVHKK